MNPGAGSGYGGGSRGCWTRRRLSRRSSTTQRHSSCIAHPRPMRMLIGSTLPLAGRGERKSCAGTLSLSVVSASLTYTSIQKRLVRKIDCRIMIWTVLMFFCLDLDRSNLSQANTDNFLPDLHMTTDDYNLGNSLFRVRPIIPQVLNDRDTNYVAISYVSSFRSSPLRSSPKRWDLISGFLARCVSDTGS